jgi:MarR family transcriptional regulator for hemolysin
MTKGSHELEAPPWLRFESTLMATSRAIRRVYDIALVPLELNLTEANLLSLVNDQGPMSQTKLADRFGMGRAGAGIVIDRLEQRGLVKRVPDPSDRRVWMVEATPGSASIIEKISTMDLEIRTRLRTGISRADRELLAEMLVRLQENLAEILDELE